MQEEVALKDYTTFKIGGPASYFAVVRSPEDVLQAVRFAQDRELPWFVLGGGSNVVIGDDGYRGVVLKMEIKGITSGESSDGVVEVTAGAGEEWDKLVAHAVSSLWYGLENLSFIPGTVGGAPIQNIGAYGVEVCEVISFVEVLNPVSGDIKVLEKDDCHFGYRSSIFKEEEGRGLVVLRVGFRLSKQHRLVLNYKDLATWRATLEHEPDLHEVRRAVGDIRAQKFPDLTRFGTAGSYFKNPVVSKEQAAALKVRFPELPVYGVSDTKSKISLAWILDHVVHLRGVRRGTVGTFERQPLVLVNYGDATAKELHSFAQAIAEDVQRACGITIVPEVVSIGV